MGNQKSSPKLYKRDSKGKMRVWQIKLSEVQNGTTYQVTHSGILGGKIVQRSKPISDSKQKKSFPRAVTLMDNTVVKKLRDGYHRSPEEAENAGVLFKPMLAQTYKPNDYVDKGKLKKATRLPYGFYAQPKINGVRAPYHEATDTLHTKSGLKYSIANVHEEIKKFSEIHGISLDGELFIKGLTAPEITGVAKRMNDSRRKYFEYYIYDCMTDQPFKDRWKCIQDTYRKFVELYGLPKYIRLVDTIHIVDPADVQRRMDHWIYLDYEGAMLRLGDEGYEYGKRTKNLLKWKLVEDGEYEVVGITYEQRRGNNTMMYLVEFHCKFDNGETFKVIPKWDVQKRYQWYLDHKDTPLDQLLPTLLPLLVEYREVTVNGLPFHAVGIDFREHGY